MRLDLEEEDDDTRDLWLPFLDASGVSLEDAVDFDLANDCLSSLCLVLSS